VDSLSEAILSIQLAYKQIFSSIRMPFTFSSYSDLVQNPNDYQSWLCTQVGLPFIGSIEVVNGDTKYNKA